MPVVEARNIRFSYEDGPEVLTDVSLTVDEGEFVALLGANGAGKTTFAKMLNGILQPDSGTIRIEGEDIIGKKTAELASWVGYCYQNPDHQIFADSVSKELSRYCRFPEEISEAINTFRSRTPEEVRQHQELSISIKNDYFEPVTKEGIHRFLQLEAN